MNFCLFLLIQTFMVVGKDQLMFRFSAKNALFVLSPFNPVRRIAIHLLTHPYPFIEHQVYRLVTVADVSQIKLNYLVSCNL